MSVSPLSVRGVVDADYARWLPLWDAYNEFYGRVGATALPIEVTRATWERFFDPREPVHALVAEDAGAIVGIAHYLFHRSTTSIAHTCYLQDLFTVESARGRGIARALVSAVCDAANGAGSSRVL